MILDVVVIVVKVVVDVVVVIVVLVMKNIEVMEFFVNLMKRFL